MSLLALFHSSKPAKCYEFDLVLQAVSIDSQVVNHQQRYFLLVEEAQAPDAYRHLKLYLEENAEKQEIRKPLRPVRKGFFGAYIYGLVLLIVGALKSANAFTLYWQTNGLAHSEKILDGEWWRTLTALSLHANSGHLAGNIGFGALFGILVSQYLGSGAAWFTILVAGGLGNALNAYWYPSLHVSIGASTMVFAALGILGVFAQNQSYAQTHEKIRKWAPFVATVALLGFIGTGGERTDIMAHLSGYLAGMVCALIWLSVLRRSDAVLLNQSAFASAAISLVCLAWGFALT